MCINEDTNLETSISNICRYEYDYFLNKQNVVGVGCGYKVINGFRTCILCIQVFMKKKLPKNLLLENELIPSHYKGIPTDVIETGEAFTCSLKNKIRPVLGGYAVSIEDEYAYGSICCLVSNGVSNFILSTNHVLTNENQIPIGTNIIQPAYRYGGKTSKDTMGTLHKFIPLRFVEGSCQPINLSDCALGLLTKQNLLSSDIALIGKLKGVKKSVKLSDEVKKVGCSSELTTGHVNTIHATTIIRFPSGKRCLFQDLIFTSAMAESGDSGSILVNKYNYAIGMLLSLNETNSLYCYLSTVLDQLDVHLIT